MQVQILWNKPSEQAPVEKKHKRVVSRSGDGIIA